MIKMLWQKHEEGSDVEAKGLKHIRCSVKNYNRYNGCIRQ
jgi:hypothetical protein